MNQALQRQHYKFEELSLRSLLYNVEDKVFLQNLACLFMSDLLVVPLPSNTIEQERSSTIKIKLCEWSEIFKSYHYLHTVLPFELAESIAIFAFKNDPAMAFVTDKMILMKLHNYPTLEAVLTVNLIFIQLSKQFSNKYSNLKPEQINSQHQKIYRNLKKAMEETNTEYLSKEIRTKILDRIKLQSQPVITKKFLRNALNFSRKGF